MANQDPSASLIVIRRHGESETEKAEPAEATLTANWDLRQRSRFRARLDDGREVALVLPRGGVLRAGDRLLGECGLRVDVRPAPENLMVAETPDANLFARACYHMGNRHVPLQVEANRMAFQPDHVLGAMLEALGLELSQCEAPFDPEAGAYAGGHSATERAEAQGSPAAHSHPHSHPHSHAHSQAHSHPHPDPDGAEAPARGPRIHRMSEAALEREVEESSGG